MNINGEEVKILDTHLGSETIAKQAYHMADLMIKYRKGDDNE